MNNTTLVIDVWDTIRENIQPKDREDVAYRLLRILEEHDIIDFDLKELEGEDKDLDKAIDLIHEEDDEEAEDSE